MNKSFVLLILFVNISFMTYSQIKTTRLINDEIGGEKKIQYNIIEEDGFKRYIFTFIFQNEEYSSITDLKNVACFSKECLESFLKDLKDAALSSGERTNLTWKRDGYKYSVNKYDFTNSIYISELDGTSNYTKLNKDELEKMIIKLMDIDFGSDKTKSGKPYNVNDLSKVELYNLGFDAFKKNDYQKSDSLFSIYKTKYPHELYGHYWCFRSKIIIDSTMEKGLALEDCKNFIKIAEADPVKNKSTLITAYGYLAGYVANVEKDLSKALGYLQDILRVDPYHEDARKNAEILKRALQR
jgi:hypothetical protein